MKPLYISSSGPRCPHPPPSLLHPQPSGSLFKISFGFLPHGPTPPLAFAGWRGCLPQLPSPVWTHISFSLSHFPPAPPFSPSPPPTTTAASLDPFRIADILSALHTSLRPQQPSLMDWRGGGGPQLGKMVGNRVEVGK